MLAYEKFGVFPESTRFFDFIWHVFHPTQGERDSAKQSVGLIVPELLMYVTAVEKVHSDIPPSHLPCLSDVSDDEAGIPTFCSFKEEPRRRSEGDFGESDRWEKVALKRLGVCRVGKIDHRVGKKNKNSLKILSWREKATRSQVTTERHMRKRWPALQYHVSQSQAHNHRQKHDPFTLSGFGSGLCWVPTCAAGGAFFLNLVTVTVTGQTDGNESRERQYKLQEWQSQCFIFYCCIVAWDVCFVNA